MSFKNISCRFVFFLCTTKIDSIYFLLESQKRKITCLGCRFSSLKSYANCLRFTRCLRTFCWYILYYGSCKNWSGWWLWSSICYPALKQFRKLRLRKYVACCRDERENRSKWITWRFICHFLIQSDFFSIVASVTLAT